MSEQRDDCDRFCMAPHGNHHWRCPAIQDDVRQWWRNVGRSEYELASAAQVVEFFRTAPDHVAFRLATDLLEVVREADECIVRSHKQLIAWYKQEIARLSSGLCSCGTRLDDPDHEVDSDTCGSSR